MSNEITTRNDLLIRIDGRTWKYTGPEAASKAYRAAIYKVDATMHTAPDCEIIRPDGTVVGRISYNGRVWEVSDGYPQYDRCIFNPYADDVYINGLPAPKVVTNSVLA